MKPTYKDIKEINKCTMSKVRKYFFSNPNSTLQEIANKFNISKSKVQEYLTNKDNLNIVPSLNESNLYFLFSDLMERKIITETDGRTVKNDFDFTFVEKTFLRSFGFSFTSLIFGKPSQHGTY